MGIPWNEYGDYLEAVIVDGMRQALEQTAKDIARQIESETDPRRKKTREAIRIVSRPFVQRIGLQFAERYASRNTATHRNFKAQWTRLRPRVKQRLLIRFRETLKG